LGLLYDKPPLIYGVFVCLKMGKIGL